MSKVTFNPGPKLITVNAGETEVDVKLDIYSAWKIWVLQGNNSQYLQALRTTGGDPVGGGEFTGDSYFLINGWRIEVDHSCNFDGVIYSDDFPSPFLATGGFIVTNKVSSLVNTISSGSGLSSNQHTMLLEMYELLGLDPTKPLVVTNTSRTAGTIDQTIATSPTQTVVTRI